MSSRGSIRKDPSGTWSFVVDLPAAGSRRRQVRRRGFATRRDAQAALVNVLADLQQGQFVKPGRITVGQYLGSWTETLAMTGRKEATISSYRHNLRLHVVPHVGEIRLQALTPLDLDRLYVHLLQHGRQNGGGGPLSRRTVRYVHTILSAALQDAVTKGVLQKNPATNASPPSAKSTTSPEMSWWTPEQLRTFLSYAADHELSALFRLAAMTGMRRGELVGLWWTDVDLGAAKLVIRRQLVTTDYRLYWGKPKTQRGRRTIDLDGETVVALRLQRNVAGEVASPKRDSRSKLIDVPEGQLVFPTQHGEVRHPETISEQFARLVRKSRLPRIRFHDLRHSHVAHLLSVGVDPLAISRRLGHSSVAFTLDRYGHLLHDAGATAAARVAGLVDRAGGLDGTEQ